MAHGNIGTPLGQGDLDAGRAPGDECREATFPNTQQTLVHVRGVDFALDDVQDRDVAALLAGDGRHHAVLGLEQPPHDVENGRLAHGLGLLDLISGEGGICRHEEMAPWCRDERCQDADEIVVHVPGVSQSSCAS